MSLGNLAACLAVTLPHEGGYVDHPKDPGGATNMGITMATLAGHRGRAVTKAEVRAMGKDEAREIYRVGYWAPVQGDRLPAGVDLSAFDYGVNSGPSRSVKELQRVLGVAADGRAGPETLTAAAKADGKATIQKHCGRRLSFVRGLGTFKTFGRGWSRRVADIEARGVAMWLRRETAFGGEAAILAGEADKAKEKASSLTKTAGGTAAGGVAVSGGDAAISGGSNWLPIAVALAVVAVVAGILIIKSRQNKDRAEAYARVAAEQALT